MRKNLLFACLLTVFLPVITFGNPRNVSEVGVDNVMHIIPAQDALVYEGKVFPTEPYTIPKPFKCWVTAQTGGKFNVQLLFINLIPTDKSSQEGIYQISDSAPTYFNFDGILKTTDVREFHVEFINLTPRSDQVLILCNYN